MSVCSKQKQVLSLLSDGQFHSGTALAKKIGTSRSAVCNFINKLSDLGVEFSAVSGKGYRLDYPSQLLSTSLLKTHLKSDVDALISTLEIYDCIDSTNSYLVEKSKQSTQRGLVCFAEYQMAGRGRRGRHWVSPFASNINMSISWQFQGGPASISGLSLAVGVAVIQALNEIGIEDVGLKWPNDIYWQGRKLGGILIEVAGETDGPCFAVIGLGFNLYLSGNQAQSITQDWVDLNEILATSPAKMRNKIAAILLNHLMPIIAGYEQQGLKNYLTLWREFDCMRGKQVDIFMGKLAFSGRVEGIDDEGLLLLADKDGIVKKFASGEVSFSQT